MRERAKIVVIARACAVILLELAVRLLRYYFPRLRVCRRYCPSVCCAVAMPPSTSDEMIVSRSFFIKVSFRLIDMYVFFCHAALPPCRHCHARCAGVRVVFPSSSVGCGGRVSRVTPTSLQCVSCSRPFVCRRMQGAGVSWSVSVSLANLQKKYESSSSNRRFSSFSRSKSFFASCFCECAWSRRATCRLRQVALECRQVPLWHCRVALSGGKRY